MAPNIAWYLIIKNLKRKKYLSCLLTNDDEPPILAEL